MQELRIAAFVSKEPVWIDAFINKRDLHGEVASMVFGVDISEVKSKPDFLRGKSYRDVAKTVNFALLYGSSKFKLADTLSISVEEADSIMKKYFANLPKINEYLITASTVGLRDLQIRTCKPFRMIRFFKDPQGDKKAIGTIERASKNTVIQGTGAQMTKLAMCYIRRYIKQHNLQDKVKIVMTVHDQVDCEVAADYAEEWSKIQQGIMQQAGQVIVGDVLPITSDITIGDYWQK